jgi:hypothetical protein
MDMPEGRVKHGAAVGELMSEWSPRRPHVAEIAPLPTLEAQ